MKVMSFNCRGLARPQKKAALRRIIFVDGPDIILLQETLGVGTVVKARLEGWLPGWSFESLDARGRSSGLAVGWKDRTIKSQNLWGMESVLGLNFLSLELGETFNIFNIYGPYQDRIPFWDSLLGNSLLKSDSLILGGDMNFTLGQSEVWGPHAQIDTLTGY